MESDQIINTKLVRIIVDEKYRLLRHVGFLLLGAFLLLYPTYLEGNREFYWYYRSLCIYSILILAFYTNMYILMPRFFFKGRYVTYFIALFLLVRSSFFIIAILINTFFNSINNLPHNNEVQNFQSTFIVISIVLLTSMIKLFQQWVRDNEKISELKNLTLVMELGQLRNQINPHFLFNMLNGIKALVRTDPEKANLIIMKLSDFLRYQLYENSEEKVLLKSEIVFLINYLELEMLRKDNLSVEIVPSKENLSAFNGIFIPPNLFTTFVENAVKHSVSITGEISYIKINLEIKNKKLHFSCINSTDLDYVPSKEKNNGLGLSNIKRRLDLLYEGNHALQIQCMNNEYHVKLTIPL